MSDDLVLVADVDREQVTWLWRNRVPRRKVVVLDGDPGTGKSTLTLTIAPTCRPARRSPMASGPRSATSSS
jgi:tRNA A37 threonylcarbamoyladenosine biosynthesis protein TsaE